MNESEDIKNTLQLIYDGVERLNDRYYAIEQNRQYGVYDLIGCCEVVGVANEFRNLTYANFVSFIDFNRKVTTIFKITDGSSLEIKGMYNPSELINGILILLSVHNVDKKPSSVLVKFNTLNVLLDNIDIVAFGSQNTGRLNLSIRYLGKQGRNRCITVTNDYKIIDTL